MKKKQQLCELCSGNLNGLARELRGLVVCQDCYDSDFSDDNCNEDEEDG